MNRTHDQILQLLEKEMVLQADQLQRPRAIEWEKEEAERRGKIGYTRRHPEEVFQSELVEGQRRVLELLGEEACVSTSLDLYFNRYDFLQRLARFIDYKEQRNPVAWAELLLQHIFAQHVPEDLPARVEKRLEFIFRNAWQPVESHNRGNCYGSANFAQPTLAGACALLFLAKDRKEAIRVAAKVIDGAFNYGPFEVPTVVYENKQRSERIVQRHSYDRFRFDQFTYSMADLFMFLAQEGELTVGLMESGVRNLPGSLNQVGRYALEKRNRYTPEAIATVCACADRVVRKFAEAVDADWSLLLQSYELDRGCWLEGGWYLLQAAHHHHRLKLGKLSVNSWGYYFGNQALTHWVRSAADKKDKELAIIHLAHAKKIVPDDPGERAALVTELKKFPAKSLEALLPVCPHGFPVLCEALGWESAIPLIDSVYVAARLRGYKAVYAGGYATSREDATANVPDPNNGVLNVVSVRALITSVGEKLAEKVLDLIVAGNKIVASTATLYSAVAGFNADEIHRGIAKRNQTAVKALGLLPLRRAESEALERYLELKEFTRESNEFGTERRANEHAAVQAALSNLAQVAGYRDALRLEWALEARLTQEMDPFANTWTAGDCRAELRWAGGEPRLFFYKSDKALQQAPAAIKSSEHYNAMKELQKVVQQQFKRLRQTFENMMCLGDSLTGSDLKSLVQLPVARHLISRVVFAAGEAANPIFGVYQEGSLRPLAGKPLPLDEGDLVTIAHPHTLFMHQQLAAWQAEIVRREWLQPFKQVFREVYVPTADEQSQEGLTRYSLHCVKASVAAKLLASRNWEMRSSDTAEVLCFDRRRGLLARWEFSEPGHYLGEMESTGAGKIGFYTAEADGDRYRTVKRLRIHEVPPVFFSEVARDADLVTSVASVEPARPASQEVLARRKDAIRLVLQPMQLPGVSFDQNCVRVQGKLANYQITYGGSILREPDHPVGVLPLGARLGKEKLFLPFSDEEDPAVSNVVTAAILLAHDDQISNRDLAEALGIECGAASPQEKPARTPRTRAASRQKRVR